MNPGPFVYCQVHRRTVPLSEAVKDESTGNYTCTTCANLTLPKGARKAAA